MRTSKRKAVKKAICALIITAMLCADARASVFAAEAGQDAEEAVEKEIAKREIAEGELAEEAIASSAMDVGATAQPAVLEPAYSENKNRHEYSGNWADTVKSYLYENPAGGLTRVEYIGELHAGLDARVIVEDYDSLFTLRSSSMIPVELPVWGGFYAGKDFNYVIFGQENMSENDKKEVVRIVKYSKDWRRLGHASIRGANTTYPFSAGSLRCAEDGDYLYIRTCHQMYQSSDGLNHQANMTIVVRQSDMAITNSFHRVSNLWGSGLGYVSHSFNQFIIFDQERRLVTLDHGDFYPRSLVLCRYYWKAESEKFNDYEKIEDLEQLEAASDIQIFPEANKYHYNYTGASVGGLAETKSGYVTAFNYAWEEDDKKVYLGYTAKDGLSSVTVPISEAGAGTPVLVPEGLDGGYVLWTDKKNAFCYAKYSANGTAGAVSKSGNAALSDCQPVFYNGEFVWYVTTSKFSYTGGNSLSIVPTFAFYRLDPATGKITATSLEMKKLTNVKIEITASLASEEAPLTVEALTAAPAPEETAAPEGTAAPEETAGVKAETSPEETVPINETSTPEEASTSDEAETPEETATGAETETGAETDTVPEDEAPSEETSTTEETASEEASSDEAPGNAPQNSSIVFSETDIAHGEYKENGSNITWAIDKDGKLTVEGTGDFAPDYNSITPWYNYSVSILSAEIRVTGATRASYMFSGCGNLTSLDLSKFDTSKVTSMGGMFRNCSSLKNLDLSSFDTGKATSMDGTFYNCSSLQNLDLSSFDTRYVRSMTIMFAGCSSLTSLDLSSFDTRYVEPMSRMFAGCSSLTSLDLSGFNTRNVLNTERMFAGCGSLTSLNLSGFDISNTGTMSGMFAGCSSLKNLDLSGFNTSRAYNMSGMFAGCSSLTSLDLSSFNTSRVGDMSGMFANCTSLKSLDLSKFDTSRADDMSGMFLGCRSLASLDLSKFDTSQVANTKDMFFRCDNLKSLNLSNFNTSNVTDMAYMFYACSSLKSLDLSSFDASKVADMSEMFSHCTSLTSLNLSKFNTSQAANMAYMFSNCTSLASLDLSSFDTSNVTDMQGMFTNCVSLTSLNLGNFNTSQVADMKSMFCGCTNLDELDLSKFNTGKALYMDLMFADCNSLTNLDFSGFNTSQAITMNGMFYGCGSLAKLDLSKFDTSNVADMGWMFYDCSSLAELNLSKFNTGNTLYIYDMFADCSSLTSLDLSSFDAGQMTNMDRLFDACIKLQKINTPYNVTKSVPLPAGTWKKENGSKLTELPQNQDSGISITRTDSPDIPAPTVIASGEYRENGSNVVWEISLDGKLTVTGVGEFANPGGNIRTAPWYKYRKSILSAEICVTGMTDASRMFYGCSSLTSLDLSGFDMGQIIAGGCDEIFPTPHKLQTIYTPYNLKTPVLLPSGSWRKDDGTALTELPQNPDYSILLQNGDVETMPAAKPEIKAVKQKTVYSFGEALTLDDITVKYYAADRTAKKLESSAYTTNADSIDMKKAEKQTLTITYQAGGITLRADIELTILPFVPVESVGLDKNTLTLEAGQTASLLPTVMPENATEKAVEWASSNPAVASAADGIVRAIAAGKCDIVAMAGQKSAVCKVAVTGSAAAAPANNLQISLADGDEYGYTGRAIKPAVIVTNNGAKLIEGQDYALSYKNNTKAADKTARSAPTVTVNGRGRLSGSFKLPFTIRQKEIGDEEIKAGNVIVISGKTAAPILFFDGVKLGTKDFTVSPNASTRFFKDDVITVTGKGNFTGSRKVAVKVMQKEDAKSFTVAIDSAKLKSSPLVYDGSPKALDSYLSVYDSKDTAKAAPLRKGTDYDVIYPENHTDAGTVKFAVIGLGIYGGAITKAYSILPKAIKDGSISVNVNDGAVYPFSAGGVSIPDIKASYGGVLLVQGRDYLVSYRNNKNACTDNKAECKISFIGNYKGSTAIIRRFNISKAELSDDGKNDGSIRIAAADMIYKKPGVYKSAPYVTFHDVLLKPSDYKASYYMDAACTQEMNGKGVAGKLDLLDADSRKVYVKIECKGNYTGTLSAEYTVWQLKEGAVDLSKIRAELSCGKKAAYTGEAITPEVSIYRKMDAASWWQPVPAEEIGAEISITYINNVNQGTATVLINGSGGRYAGSKKATFSIVSPSAAVFQNFHY